MLSVFAAFVAAATALLILAGGLVTSTGSGLSVPDWPNTYGWFMWAFPISKMVGGIFYEHLHRLVASTVGFLIVVLAIWLARVEPRRWVRRLGYLALGAVVAQGILGGITVLFFLPDAISNRAREPGADRLLFDDDDCVGHSDGWKRQYASGDLKVDPYAPRPPRDTTLERIAVVTTAIIYLQIVIGATMRHTGAGLAIPTSLYRLDT
jgi:cytochrome c oxidase assembly protein subunit 15